MITEKWKLAAPIALLTLVTAFGSVAVANDANDKTGDKDRSVSTYLRPDPRQRFVDAAVDHPGGFGGWYIEDEVIYVYMEDPSADPEAVFRDIYVGEPPDLPIAAVQGARSYDDLVRWAREINEKNRGFVTFSSEVIRQDLNRIEYGVLTTDEIVPAIAWIESIDVPRTAFEVKPI